MIKLLYQLFLAAMFMFSGFWFWYFIGGANHWSGIPVAIVCSVGCAIHLALAWLALKEMVQGKITQTKQ